MLVQINYKKMWCLLKNRPTVKKGVSLFKMASVKKSCEIKGGSQEMAVMV